MKTFIPTIILVHLYTLFLVCVFFTPALAPERMAASFSPAGEPRDWTDRPSYMVFISVFGSAVILVFAVLGIGIPLIPDRLVNFPNRDYWLTPERRDETKKYILRHLLWFASWMCCFVIGMHISIIYANCVTPPRLPMPAFYSFVGVFLLGALIWTLMIFRRFRRPAA